jgi:hypothetical protein
MIMALAGGGAPGSGHSGSSPSNSGGGHRRTGSGGSSKEESPSSLSERQPERRHSIGEASAVSKALSGSGRAGGGEGGAYDASPDRNPQVLSTSPQGQSATSSHTRRASTGMTFGVTGAGGGGGYAAGSPPTSMTASQQGQDVSDTPKKGDVDMSDDFVFIEQTAVHPWRALDTDYNNVKSSNHYMGTSPKEASPKATGGLVGSGASAHAQWYGNTSGIAAAGGNVASSSGNVSSSQDSEVMQFSWVAHRCSYMVSVVTAMTSVADAMVRETMHRHHRAQSRHVTDGTGDDESARSGSSGGGSSMTRTRAGSEGSLSEQLVPAFAVYLHAVGFVQDTIQRTIAAAKSIHKDSPLQGQIDSLLEVCMSYNMYCLLLMVYEMQSLAKRFDQLLKRADSCKKWLSDDDMAVPVPEPIIYNAALAMGQEASVEELLGNLSK